ncbi:MAG: TIM-barrel domain-containing protein [Terracidiphilus sp.]|jgi:alpha-D-xyloside xylohydrolase
MRSWSTNAQFKTLAFFAVCVAPVKAMAATPANLTAHTVLKVQSSVDGFVAILNGEMLRVVVCSDAVLHVVASPGMSAVQGASPQQPWMLDKSAACPGAKFTFSQGTDSASLITAKLLVAIDKEGGNLVFSTADGTELLREWPEGIPRTYEPVEINGVKTFHVEDRFLPSMAEAVYGLGQHQNGMFNYRGSTIELGQDNTDIAIPLLVSTRGYGLLWNTASLTYFDNRFPKMLSFSSLAENAIDYYFIYGPEMDEIIHKYRQMTGRAPMFPEWAYGFVQSKDSYISQEEVLAIAKRYRSEHIPLDCIVQDGGWWKTMGDPPFRSAYPDVAEELKELHDEHVHTMISVWGGYHEDSINYQELKANGWLISQPSEAAPHDKFWIGTAEYDATNPAARDFFWKTLPGPLLAQGWDSFWLDASEPDSGPHEGDAILLDKKMAIGSGAMYTNVFPLLHTGGIAEHWKQTTQEKRVLLLTRSAFLGEQRNGTTIWSGDVYPTNWAFRHQIAAGLNFALSGMPYWTTDVAGYFPLYDGASMTTPEYQDLYARWFEFGAFCPMFRTHGHRDHNEIWTYDKVDQVLESYDRLRYRMLPYIYSLAWKVTHDDYTMMRPLVMDWRTDHSVWDIGDEYMFGPAFLVSPVWKEGAQTREVYLPQAPAWYDFWTGERVAGGQELEVNAPLAKLPLFMRAGSIVPLAPELEYAKQEPSDPIEVRIYRGADGSFDLYEDEGDSYRYEQGAYAVIPLHWNEEAGTLTFGERIGTFAGMTTDRKFRIILVGPGHGVGEAVSSDADAVVEYTGKSEELTFPPEPAKL